MKICRTAPINSGGGGVRGTADTSNSEQKIAVLEGELQLAREKAVRLEAVDGRDLQAQHWVSLVQANERAFGRHLGNGCIWNSFG